jgi:hypothetical protein
MQLDQLNNLLGEPIFTYSRTQAVADGVLIDVTDLAKDAGFKIPVAVTEAIWNKYIEWNDDDSKKQTIQDIGGRAWDVLWMLRLAINKNKSADSIFYQIYVVPRDGKTKKAKLSNLKATIGGGDNGEPVITIMLPNED